MKRNTGRRTTRLTRREKFKIFSDWGGGGGSRIWIETKSLRMVQLSTGKVVALEYEGGLLGGKGGGNRREDTKRTGTEKQNRIGRDHGGVRRRMPSTGPSLQRGSMIDTYTSDEYFNDKQRGS